MNINELSRLSRVRGVATAHKQMLETDLAMYQQLVVAHSGTVREVHYQAKIEATREALSRIRLIIATISSAIEEAKSE